MHEILFRGVPLDDYGYEVVYGYYYVLDRAMPNSSDRHVIASKGQEYGEATVHVPVDHTTVSQYSGIHTVDGIRIFTNDIVKGRLLDTEYTGKVVFDNGAFSVDISEQYGEEYIPCLYEFSGLRIIGTEY